MSRRLSRPRPIFDARQDIKVLRAELRTVTDDILSCLDDLTTLSKRQYVGRLRALGALRIRQQILAEQITHQLTRFQAR